jgi:endo-1,4-beta-mannosidase
MIPDTPYTVRTASGGDFFDLAAQLGINTLRITDVQWTTSGEVHSRAIWQHVFDEAEKHHMNIILMLIDIDADTDGSQHTALAEAHTLLGDYGLAHAPALWLVDLNNEPDVSDPQQMTELREEAAYVHQVAPKVPVTIGGWKSEVPGHPGDFDWQDPKDIPRLIDLVDVVSPHLYGFEQHAQQGLTPQQWTQSFLNTVRQETQGKPILLEEFGAPNGLATTTDASSTGSPEGQASVYQGVLQEVLAEQDQGVIGAVAWIIAPRPASPDDDQGDMTDWALVLNHGQRLLPAAEVFSTVAHTRRAS